MTTQRIGYARVSTAEQNLDRQLDMLRSWGVDKIYMEKMSGTKRDRPELNKLLERMEEGETVVIESFSRLGRSTNDKTTRSKPRGFIIPSLNPEIRP